MAEVDLMPCPFCGSDPIVMPTMGEWIPPKKRLAPNIAYGPQRYMIICQNPSCSMRLPKETVDHAAAAWNTRSPADVDSRVAEAVAAERRACVEIVTDLRANYAAQGALSGEASWGVATDVLGEAARAIESRARSAKGGEDDE